VNEEAKKLKALAIQKGQGKPVVISDKLKNELF
jgi:hypothetical protein